MIKPQKEIHPYQINASVWLKDEKRFTVLKDLDHTPRVGERLLIENRLWQVVEWTDRIECEREVI